MLFFWTFIHQRNQEYKCFLSAKSTSCDTEDWSNDYWSFSFVITGISFMLARESLAWKFEVVLKYFKML